MTAVSIVIPARDSAAYVGSAIESVLAQTLAEWELTVVDDGSTDDTATIASAYARDPRISVVTQTAGGPAKARNAGLARSSGAYLAFLDADDLWAPDYLETTVAALRRAPEAVLGFAPWQYIDESGRLLPQRIRPYGLDPVRAREELAWRNALVPSGVVVSAPAFRLAGGFDEAFDTCADWDLWLRLRDCGSLLAVPGTVVLYRTHPANMTDDWERAAEGRLRLAAKHFRSPAGSSGPEPYEYRRAVAHALIATGLVRIRAGEHESGVSSIQEGVDRCPDVLESDDLLFELGAAFEPRGLQGTSSARRLAEGAELLESLLDRSERRRFGARARLVLARLALAAGDRRAGRRQAFAAFSCGTLREKAAAAALAAAASMPRSVAGEPTVELDQLGRGLGRGTNRTDARAQHGKEG